MTRIILVRHGETDANKAKIVQGRKLDNPLNDLGLEQAQKLGQRLSTEKIHHIYTSPQRRAYQTAEAISAHHPRTPLTTRLDLAENSMGRLEGVSLSDVLAEFPDDEWDEESFRTKIGAESYHGYLKHFSRHIPSWLKGHESHTIVLSTHGGKMKTLLKSLTKPEYWEWIKNEHPSNTSVAEVEWSPENGGRLLSYNDATHLNDQNANNQNT